MDYSALHETSLGDIYETIKKGISDLRGSSSSIGKSSSLARATSGLTLVFPVLCTDTLPIDVASMVTKAIERKATSMLQIALSAYNITNATDAIAHLQKFHTNMDIDDLTVDKFIEIMDSVAEGVKFTISNTDIKAVCEDCRRNCHYYFKDDINPISLNMYRDKGQNGTIRIVKETVGSYGNSDMDPRTKVLDEKNKINDRKQKLQEKEFTYMKQQDSYQKGIDKKEEKRYKDAVAEKQKAVREADEYRRGYQDGKDTAELSYDERRLAHQKAQDRIRNQRDLERDKVDDSRDARDYEYKQNRDKTRDAQNDRDYEYRKQNDDRNYEYRKQNDDRNYEYRKQNDDKNYNYKQSRDKDIDAMQRLKMQQTGTDNRTKMFQAVLLPQDVKKANEMQPTLILVNYYVNDNYKGLNIAQQAVAGVKANLYPIASDDIISKLITKHTDSDMILKLVKLTTREISVVKDFLLGADEAKMDALNTSKKNSGSKIFNALERRAGKNKIFKFGRMDTAYKAITSLIISSEEAEEIKKHSNLDVSKPSSIIPIMSKLNLLHFCIVDTTSEAVAILTDGHTKYEMYSFANLEREASDTNYKKVINLMTKVAR